MPFDDSIFVRYGNAAAAAVAKNGYDSADLAAIDWMFPLMETTKSLA